MTPDGVVLGYSHLGMLAAARWLMARTKATLIAALQDNPGYELRVVGELCTVVLSCLITNSEVLAAVLVNAVLHQTR